MERNVLPSDRWQWRVNVLQGHSCPVKCCSGDTWPTCSCCKHLLGSLSWGNNEMSWIKNWYPRTPQDGGYLKWYDRYMIRRDYTKFCQKEKEFGTGTRCHSKGNGSLTIQWNIIRGFWNSCFQLSYENTSQMWEIIIHRGKCFWKDHLISIYW